MSLITPKLITGSKNEILDTESENFKFFYKIQFKKMQITFGDKVSNILSN